MSVRNIFADESRYLHIYTSERTPMARTANSH